MRTALLWMPCRPPGAKLILFSACGTLGGGPVALCEPRHTRGNRGLEADLGPASEQISATVRTCEPRAACRSAHSAAWNGGVERCATIRTKFAAALSSTARRAAAG